MSTISTSHPKHCLNNIQFVMGRWIYTKVENNSVKNKYLRELKENSRTYVHTEKFVKTRTQNVFKNSSNGTTPT